MATIVSTGFSGMMPSANPKIIPDNASTYSSNTFSRFGDLRPLPTDSTVAGVTATNNAQTLYRFAQGTRPWITKSGVVNFVRGPVARDTTERTYYSGDGAPKVTNLTLAVSNAYRTLGVPAPDDAPSVTVNVVNELTTTEAEKAFNTTVDEAVKAFTDNVKLTDDTRHVYGGAGLWGAPALAAGSNGDLKYSVYTTEQDVTTQFNSVAYSPQLNLFVAVGNSNTVFSSSTGFGWLAGKVTGTNSNFNKVIWNGSRFVAVGTSGNIIYSTDGQNWVKASTKGNAGNVNAVNASFNFVAVAYNSSTNKFYAFATSDTNTAVIVSDDTTGATWTYSRTAAPWYIQPAKALYDVIVVGGEFYGVGLNGAIGKSTDGQNWTFQTVGAGGIANQHFWAIANNGSVYIAVGNNGYAYRSTNGTTWTLCNTSITEHLQDITWDSYDNIFVAVGSNGRITTTPDGVTWTNRTSGTTQTLMSASASDYVISALGFAGTNIYSNNITTWQTKTKNLDFSYLTDAAVGATANYTAGVGGTLRYDITLKSASPLVAQVDVNSDAIKSALLAIQRPDNSEPVFTSTDVDALVTLVSEASGTVNLATKSKLESLDTLIKNWLYFIDNGMSTSTTVDGLTQYFASSTIANEIANQKNILINAMGVMAAKFTGTLSAGKPAAGQDTAANYQPVGTTVLATLSSGFDVYITTGSNGAPIFDKEGAKSYLRTWLETQEQPYSTTLIDVLGTGNVKTAIRVVAPTTVKLGAGNYFDATNYLVETLAPFYTTDYWQNVKKDPKFPGTTNKAQLISNISKLATQVKALKEDIEDDEISGFSVEELTAILKGKISELTMVNYPTGEVPVTETFTYVFTWVTDWLEESAPSPAADLETSDSNDTRTVGFVGTPPANVVGWRLYRSNTGNQSSLFQLVTSTKSGDTYVDILSSDGYIPIATTSITDNVTGDYLGEECPTFGWSVPPSNLASLTGLPNGILAGHTGRTLHFCEPWKPYAWPEDYDKPLPTEIVGLGSFGQTMFVGTIGRPYIVSGADSGSMSEQILEFDQACMSARSIVSFGTGVAYAGADGLCLLGTGAPPTVVTLNILSISAWRAYNPSTMFGAFHDNRIHMFYTVGGVGGCLVWDMAVNQLFDLKFAVGINPTSAFVDSATDTLYFVSGTAVYALFGGGQRRTAKWYSKTWRHVRPVTYAWIAIDGLIDSPVTLRLYADEVLLETFTFTDIAPQRVPVSLAYDWRFEIETGTNDMVFVVLATSTAELQGLP